MSLIQTFHKLKEDQLPELIRNSVIRKEKKLFSTKTIDPYWDYLNDHAKELIDEELEEYNGTYFLFTITYLMENHGIDLSKDKFSEILSKNRGSSVMLMSDETRANYSHLLNQENLDIEKIKEHNSDFYEEFSEESAEICLEIIKLLKRYMDSLNGTGEVIVFNLG